MAKRLFLTVLLVSLVMHGVFAEAKRSDLAGSWYEASSGKLRGELEGYLADVGMEQIEGDLIGLIAPHAGFRFSGPVAAYAYKALAERAPGIVIVVGFTHRRYFPDRIAVLTDEAFITPLGRSEIDADITESLIAYDENIQSIPEAFVSENSIEMQVPFIQVVLKDARLVLIALCDQRKQNSRLLADALYSVLRDKKDFVIICSADMSHYLPYADAKEKDADTIKKLEVFDPEGFYDYSMKHRHELMCGYGAVCAVMDACKKLGADKVEILDYANSGDTSGEKNRVVGYLSAAFVKTKGALPDAGYVKKEVENMLNQTQRDELLKIARNSIRHYLETGKHLDVNVEDPVLKQDMGAFVTLHKHGRLRGCIGNMVARGPLYLAVRDMAVAAALNDPRFPLVTLDELDGIDIEISALSPMQRITDYNEIELGRHGVMVKQGMRSGVYLPQVADETGWSRDQFMSSLCASKAGISPDAWKAGECDIYVFTAEVFGEKE